MRRGFLKGQKGSQVQARASVFKLGLKNYTLMTGIWLGQIFLAAPDPKPARLKGKRSANFSECWIRALNRQPGGKKNCAAARCTVEEGLVLHESQNRTALCCENQWAYC